MRRRPVWGPANGVDKQRPTDEKSLHLTAYLTAVFLSCVADPLLGVAREEFVKSIRQFLKVESEMFPVFIITNPGSE